MRGETIPSIFPSRAYIFALHIFPVIGTALFTVAVVGMRLMWLLPLAQCLCFYPAFGYCLWHGWRKRAIILGLLWALTLAGSIVALTATVPESTSATVLYGVEYKEEMYEWVRTGIGTESQPLQFIPRHVATIILFAATSILTGSIVSLLLGAVMMNYMSFYVGSLIHDSTALIPPLLLGWHIWAIFRVVSFVILGVVLAEPVWAKIRGVRFSLRAIRVYMLLASTGLLLDMILKALLAPVWATLLRSYLP